MTIRSEATRLVDSSSSSVYVDTGLAALCRDLADIFENEEEEDLVDTVRSHLDTEYGSSNVQEDALPERYEFYWDAGAEAWKKHKIEGSTWTIDDGETYQLEAKVFIWSIQ